MLLKIAKFYTFLEPSGKLLKLFYRIRNIDTQNVSVSFIISKLSECFLLIINTPLLKYKMQQLELCLHIYVFYQVLMCLFMVAINYFYDIGTFFNAI